MKRASNLAAKKFNDKSIEKYAKKIMEIAMEIERQAIAQGFKPPLRLVKN